MTSSKKDCGKAHDKKDQVCEDMDALARNTRWNVPNAKDGVREKAASVRDRVREKAVSVRTKLEHVCSNTSRTSSRISFGEEEVTDRSGIQREQEQRTFEQSQHKGYRELSETCNTRNRLSNDVIEKSQSTWMPAYQPKQNSYRTVWRPKSPFAAEYNSILTEKQYHVACKDLDEQNKVTHSISGNFRKAPAAPVPFQTEILKYDSAMWTPRPLSNISAPPQKPPERKALPNSSSNGPVVPPQECFFGVHKISSSQITQEFVPDSSRQTPDSGALCTAFETGVNLNPSNPTSTSSLYSSVNHFLADPTYVADAKPAFRAVVSFTLSVNVRCTMVVLPSCSAHDQVRLLEGSVSHVINSVLPWEWFQYRDNTSRIDFYHNWSTNLTYPYSTNIDHLFQSMSGMSLYNATCSADHSIPPQVQECPWSINKVMDTVCKQVIEAEYTDKGCKLELVKSAFNRGIYGDDTGGAKLWHATKLKNGSRNFTSPCEKEQIMYGVYVFPRSPITIRRALIIGCTYPDSSTYFDSSNMFLIGESKDGKPVTQFSPHQLPGTVEDALNIFDMLVNRGWDKGDIVVLVDTEEELVTTRTAGCHALEKSTQENVVRWMGRMMSCLPLTSNHQSASFFCYFAGHGDQRHEFPEGSSLTETAQTRCRTEDDGKDEFIMLSDYKRIYNGPVVNWFDGPRPCQMDEFEEPFTDKGMLVDNDINKLLCEPVFLSPNTQLILVFDCCSSGTGADLPFELNEHGSWYTTGEAATDEEQSKVIPMPWQCGKGIVWCLSACRDTEQAGEVQGKGGILTTALTESLSRSRGGKETFKTVFSAVRDLVVDYSSPDPSQHNTNTQTSTLSCSHCCSLDSYFVL